MAGQKPNEFNVITPTGVTELYSQTNGINGKFTLSQLLTFISSSFPQLVGWSDLEMDISASQILSMGTNPIEILPAPGIGKYYIYHGIFEFTFNSSQYIFGGTEGSPYIYDSKYGGTVMSSLVGGLQNSITPFSNYTPNQTNAAELTATVTSQAINSAIYLSTWNAGNPTLGDGTLKLKLKYKICDFG
jgi:hypothetical protein